MILKNDDERSWMVDIKHGRKYCCLGQGWKGFCAANGLKEGDLIKLELVSNGDIPVSKVLHTIDPLVTAANKAYLS
ncbi:putative transcription factor B3-Domain family [Helianthus annuus]|nr:putative transcription factor B3-Domain family [Helianthus annuus]